MWSFVGFILAGGLVFAGGASAVPPTAEAPPLSGTNLPGPRQVETIPELEEAMGFLKKGDLDAALALLKSAVKKYPGLPPIQVMMARWFAAMNQPAQMRSALERAIADEPNDPEAYALLAEMALRDYRITETGFLYAKVLELTEGDKERASPREMKRKQEIRRQAHTGLASVAEARQDWAGAQKHLQALLDDDPDNVTALGQLGRALFQQKKYDEAYERLRKAGARDKNLLNAEAAMGNLHLQAGDNASAYQWLSKAVASYPRDSRTRLVVVEYFVKVGDLKQAAEQADGALTIAPESLDAQMAGGVVGLFAKDYETAEKFFQQARLQAPGAFAATSNLVIALCEQNSDTKRRLALEYAQVHARAFSDQPEAFSTLGRALHRLGRMDEAESALRKAVSLGRITPNTAYYFARVLVDRGRKEEAQKVIAQVLEPALKGSASFVYRKEAEALVADFKKSQE